MKLTLPPTIASIQDVRSLQLELHEYAKWFSHNAIKKRVGAHHPAPQPEVSPACQDLIREWTNTSPLTEISLDKLLAELKSIENSAPSITITLAAPALGELRQNLIAWCRKNIADDVLVNFQFNSTILGGMVVRYGSHIHDWSFRRTIMDNRAKFPEVLRNA